MKYTYDTAGVSIDTADSIKSVIKKHAKTTVRPEVLAGPGLFGGMFELKGYRQPVLVSSIDGVGTKLKIADAMDRHDTVGQDLVNHCVNDILTCGAEPLFLLDYIAMGKLSPDKVESVVKGMSSACKESNCALIGGETAEMPGLYAIGDYDLAACIIGVVEKENIIDGTSISAGDIAIGLASNGLHTNGYSLARKVLGDTPEAIRKFHPELGKTVGEALLETHICYLNRLKYSLALIKGMAHVTGGGLPGNVPRILPDSVTARFDSSKWDVPYIFKLIQEKGEVDVKEMYHVFNMGIGMVVFCSPENVSKIIEQVPGAKVIGDVIKQAGNSRVIIEQAGVISGGNT
ncbi:MAG: phosphoribosylformylglycinamidine cyclo-ligase [Dehalococcoidales bacterium]|nr:phosphoribosylformylglycinamidine cyclo-ligase [Dehalococcoidales bacterium]